MADQVPDSEGINLGALCWVVMGDFRRPLMLAFELRQDALEAAVSHAGPQAKVRIAGSGGWVYGQDGRLAALFTEYPIASVEAHGISVSRRKQEGTG